MTWRMPEVKSVGIGDADIEYLHYPGDGPPLLLLHATGFMPWLWHPVARELADRYEIFVPYFCDHRPAEPEDGLSWLLLAEDLALVIERLELSAPRIVGHSMGAVVATLHEAHRGPLAERMVLIEPIYLPREFYKMEITVERHPLASKSIRRRNAWSGRDEASDYLLSKDLFSRWDPEVLELYLDHGLRDADAGGLTLACHPRREAALFMGGREHDPWPLLPLIECPALLLEGEVSENRPFIDLKKAASQFPNGGYMLIEGAGHLVPMERPREVARAAAEFFGE